MSHRVVGRSVLLALCAALVSLLALGVGSASAFEMKYEHAFNGEEGGKNLLPKEQTFLPKGVAVNEETGKVYALDAANDAIDVFSGEGKYEEAITAAETKAKTFGFNKSDNDIAIDNVPSSLHKGYIYVADEAEPGVDYAFDPTGKLVWESQAGVGDNCGIAVDPSGNPWLGDYKNGIQELNFEGNLTGAPALLVGQSVCHIDFDSAGNLLVNFWNKEVERFNAKGEKLNAINQLTTHDVAVERATDTVYTVSENLGNLWLYAWEDTGKELGHAGEGVVTNPDGVTVNAGAHKVYVSDAGSSFGPSQIEAFSVSVPDTLTVAPAGSGSGSVSAESGAISNCSSTGGTCSAAYREGTVVKLKETAQAGSRFAGWSGGGCSGTTPECEVTMSADTTVTATFEPNPTFALKVTKAGTGQGTVTSSPAGIDCGTGCEASFEEGAQVTLTAAASEHSTFTGWSGACTGTASTCTVTMSAAKEAIATFAQDAPVVTTGSAAGISQTGATLSGTVNPDGATVSACEVQYGTSTGYGMKAACSSLPGAGTGPVGVSAVLSGLTAGTTYHYRFLATNPGGTTYGADATFTTAAAPAKEGPKLEGPPQEVPVVQGVLGLASTTSVVKSGKAPVKLSCTGQTTCAGTVKITVKVKHGKHNKTLTAGSAHVSVPAGQTITVNVHITGQVQHLLAKHHKLAATLTGPGLHRALLLKAGSKQGHKRGK